MGLFGLGWKNLIKPLLMSEKIQYCIFFFKMASKRKRQSRRKVRPKMDSKINNFQKPGEKLAWICRMNGIKVKNQN